MNLRCLATLGLLAVLAPLAATQATESRPPAQPDLRSNAFYVVDDSGSKVLTARRETVVAPIASITKLMTALVVLEAKQPLDEKIAITRTDVQQTAAANPAIRRYSTDAEHTLTRIGDANRIRIWLLAGAPTKPG